MSDSEKERVQEFWDLMIEELCDGNKAEFSRLIKMSPQSFHNYYIGDRKPGWDILKRIFALGYSLNAFVGGLGPKRINQLDYANVSTIGLIQEEGEGDTFANKENKDKDKDHSDPGNDFFNHINPDDLSETEHDLLAEVKRFSNFLKTTGVPLQVKRLMLELMIEHIDQEIERLRGNQS